MVEESVFNCMALIIFQLIYIYIIAEKYSILQEAAGAECPVYLPVNIAMLRLVCLFAQLGT